LIEDFKPEIKCIKGETNADADTLSRCPMSDEPIDHLDMVEAFLNYPSDVDQFPVQCDTLLQAQEADDQVLGLLEDKDLCFVKTIGGHKLVCRRLRGDQWSENCASRFLRS